MSEDEGGDADDDAEEGESSRRAAKSHSSSSATGERRTRAKVSDDDDDDDDEDSEEGSDRGAPSERHLNHRCEVYDSHRYCAAATTTTVTNTLFLPYFGPFGAQLSIIYTFLFQLAEHSIVVSQFSVSIIYKQT